MSIRTWVNIGLIVGLIALFVTTPQLRRLIGLGSSQTITIDSPNQSTNSGSASADSANSEAAVVEPPAVEELELVTLLSKDAIPSIDNPQFVTGDEADEQYSPDELVLGVEIDGDARAYSIPFLSGHEIVNDVVAGQPIAVTW